MSSRYPYEGFQELSGSVLWRDGYTCQWCGKKKGDTVRLYASARGEYEYVLGSHNFVAHHKDGDKLNNTMENLITVCKSCHSSHHRKGRTKEKVQTERWRRNYYKQKKAEKKQDDAEIRDDKQQRLEHYIENRDSSIHG
jgi:5-methylcytosine-specific restriction endonuclease McrA